MSTRAWKWGPALALSSALHAGAAAILLPGAPEVLVAGGARAEIALLGTAFADLSAPGVPSGTVKPATQETETILPEEPDVAAEPAKAVDATPAEAVEAQTAEPVDPVSAAEMPDTPTIASLPPEPARTQAAEPAPAAPRTAAIEPEPPKEEIAAMVPVPRPTPRPHYEPPKRSKQARAPAAKRIAPPRAERQAARSAGSGGRDSQDARRSASDGSSAASAVSQGAARTSEQGNVDISNYPGKIVAKLRRALRYPQEARRERLRAEVRVSFTVASNGAVSGIRVVASSGSPVLDRAAVETVRRAAPFPSIPKGAGRSSWPFTVPLAFVR